MHTVSVVIPTYNRANYIVSAIESVLCQTTPVDEILVIDDGSTDNTAEVVGKLAKVRYIRQKNAGPSAARNRGIRESRGSLIAFHDSDDLWAPEKIALQVAQLERNPKLDFTFGYMSNFSSDHDPIVPEIKDHAIDRALNAGSDDVPNAFNLLLEDNFIPTPTVLLKRTCIEKVGAFDETLRCAEDYDLWLRIAATSKIGFINQVLLRRRRHESNLVNDFELRSKSQLEVLRKLSKSQTLSAEQIETLHAQQDKALYDLGSYYFHRRNFPASWTLLRQCQKKTRRSPRYCVKAMIAFSFSVFSRKN